MGSDRIYKKFLATLFTRLDEIEKSLTILKTNYTIQNLEKLRKLLNHLANDLKLCGDIDNSRLAQQYECDLIAKTNNYYGNNADLQWIGSVQSFIANTKNTISKA